MPAEGCTCTHTCTLLTWSNVIKLSEWEGSTGNRAPTVRSTPATCREAFQQKLKVSSVIFYAPRHDIQSGFRVWLHLEDPSLQIHLVSFVCHVFLRSYLLQSWNCSCSRNRWRPRQEHTCWKVLLPLPPVAPGAGGGSVLELVNKKKKKGERLVGRWCLVATGGKQKVWWYNRGSCSSKLYDMWDVYFSLIDCDNHDSNICLFLLCKERRRRPHARIKKQKSKWKFILIEFPHGKLGSHAVRLEKHGTIPQSSILFFFFPVLCTQIQMKTVLLPFSRHNKHFLQVHSISIEKGQL